MNVKRKATSSLSAAVSPTASKKLKQGSLTAFFGAPTVNKDIHTSSKPRFDKEGWIKGLTPSQKDLLKLEIETLHESWLAVLKDELTKPYFLNLKEFLKAEQRSGTIFPPEKEIYSWSQHTPLDRVKVVILGQDPYHNVNQAHGLCFSVRPPTPAPPSLKNIFKCLKIDYPNFTEPKTGLLTPWADRGVLLLNACLTVRAHNANSHANKGWEQFTSEVLRAVSKSTKGIVFLAWGSPAQKRIDSIGVDKIKHCILRSVHPSPLSAARGFFECKHFIKANEWLRNRYGVEGEVEWDCLAEGKKNKGLPGNTPIQSKPEETKPVVSQVKETVKEDSKTGDRTTTVGKTLVVGDTKVQTTVEDEFDDEELDQLLSSQP